MNQAQAMIDFVARNRRFIGTAVLAIGMGFQGVTDCGWCLQISMFSIAFGAYVLGAGVHNSDATHAAKQRGTGESGGTQN